MHVAREELQPHCPSCGRALQSLGGEDVSIGQVDIHRAQVYVCPAGCRGQSLDGTFEFAECPVCGSHDTCRGAQLNGAEELECNACGAVITIQLHTMTPS